MIATHIHIGVEVSLVISVYRPCNRRPRPLQCEYAFDAVAGQFLHESVQEPDPTGRIQQHNTLTLPVTGSRMAVSIPKKATVAEPGFVSIAPGKGVTTIEPVSVCLLEDRR